MNKLWMKICLPFLVIGLGISGMVAIQAIADDDDKKEPLDLRPVVEVDFITAKDYPVFISGYGDVQPFEATMLAAQVSGEVVSWNPNFVAGGLMRRGEVLFSIEKDSYEANLLQAQAELNQAQAQLIEEQALADVAKREAKHLSANRVTDLYLRKPQVLSAQAALKSAEARVKIAERDLDNTEVRAPYDALVISRDLGVGQFVIQGDVVAQLNNIETAEVRIPVAGFDQSFLPNQLAGKEAKVSTQGGQPIERVAVIERDLGVVDADTRMSQLVLRIDDPYSLKTNERPLKFGTYVEVSFAGKTLSDVYRLPQELVNNRIVWVVDERQKLAPKQVKVVREEGTYLLVSDGLSDTDRVVMTLPEYPKAGLEVKVANKDQSATSSNAFAVQSIP